MSSVLGTYARKAISFKEGKGSYLFAENGDKYLDFVQGIATNVLGHCHEHLVKTIKEQSEKLWHVSNAFIIPEQERLAKRLTDNTFADFVCFQNSGTEATEASIKIARKYFYAIEKPEKNRIITFQGAFHGRTLAALFAANNPKHTQGKLFLLRKERAAISLLKMGINILILFKGLQLIFWAIAMNI